MYLMGGTKVRSITHHIMTTRHDLKEVLTSRVDFFHDFVVVQPISRGSLLLRVVRGTVNHSILPPRI